MSATTTQTPEAATPSWLLPALSFASSTYLYVLLALAMVAAVPALAMGLDPHIISTGSMRSAVNPGDLVLTVEPEDPARLAQGEVITYQHPKHPGERVTHRIVEVLQGGGYRTQGDANNARDAYVVQPDHVVGVGQLVVPMIGLPATWLRHGMWIEFALFLLASVVAFAGATLKVDDEDDGRAEPRPERRPGSRLSAPRRVATWAQEQVAAIGALATLVLIVGIVALDRRTGALFTDRLVVAVESGAAPVGVWRTVAVAMVAVAGYLVVRVGLPGGRWTDMAGGLPDRVIARLSWFERNGTLFVAVLSLFVMTGAGTALARTAAGTFNDAMASTATMSAEQVAPPTGLTATAGCDGYSPTIDLAWTESSTTDADGYEVRRGQQQGSESLLGSISGLLTTIYEDTSLSNSTTYHYEVATTLGSWTSDPNGTATASATTPDCSPPDMWVQSVTGSSSGELLSWTASATVTVVDASGPVQGATVTGDWSGLLSLVGQTCTTGSDGSCTLTSTELVTDGSVTLSVTDVAASGHEYVPGNNATSSVTISAPSS